MGYPRVLTIQDISCVGQCSMAVALPILSACGLEACLLPTAILSTHTGGFGKPAVTHLDDALPGIWHHWQDCGITFDGILVGYLGSIPAIQAAEDILDNLLAPGGMAIIDPVMGDNGRLYSGFDQTYVQAMKGLCRRGDVLLPNLTEAALLAGVAYRDSLGETPAELMTCLRHPCTVLTGMGAGPETTGALLWQKGELFRYTHPRINRNFHGTGDIFAASFAGALFQGKSIQNAVAAAADFTYRCVEETARNPAHWYGVKFEPQLPLLGQLVKG